MIIDTIENLSNYASLNPLFADVVAFLNANDLQTMEPGKYPIKDKDLFLNLQVAKQRTKETQPQRPSAIRPSATCPPSSTIQRRTSRNMATPSRRRSSPYSRDSSLSSSPRTVTCPASLMLRKSRKPFSR